METYINIYYEKKNKFNNIYKLNNNTSCIIYKKNINIPIFINTKYIIIIKKNINLGIKKFNLIDIENNNNYYTIIKDIQIDIIKNIIIHIDFYCN